MNNEILDFRYKERTPIETIQIIKDFFKEKGFTLDLEKESQSEAETYSCHIKLYFEDDFIMFSNGKGATKDLALASGYAEMYERFCNRIKIYTQKNLYTKFKNVNQKCYGYKIHPEEKVMTYEDAVLNEPIINKYFSILSNNNDKIKEHILRSICNDEFLGLPYNNIITNEKKFIDPQLVLRFNNSTGMCAGNTFEEAFNEGFSEILERYCYIDLISSEGLSSYKVIKEENLNNSVLKGKIENIKKAGYDFYLIDLSYEYELPVIMGVLVNKKDHFCRLNFGSFPVFEVAAMRTITEVYQNVISYDRYDDLIQVPSEKNFNVSYFFQYNGTGLSEAAYVPPYFFQRLEYVDSYNKNIYMNEDSSPFDIFNYYKKFIKDNELNVWISDNSLSKDLYSMHIFVDNICYFYPMDYIVDYDKIDYNELILKIETLKKYEFMLYNDIPNFSKINYLDKDLISKNIPEMDLFTLFTYSPTLYPYTLGFELFSRVVMDINETSDGSMVRRYASTFLFPYLKKYYTLRRYICSDYSYEEILPIAEKLGIENLSRYDYESCEDLNYVLLKAVIEPCWNYYHSEKYERFCLSHTEKI